MASDGAALKQVVKEEPVGEEDEVVRCECGATDMSQEGENFSGLWLQCDRCNRWQHGQCAGYPKKAPEGVLMARVSKPDFSSWPI